jgi:hypothetical protein
MMVNAKSTYIPPEKRMKIGLAAALVQVSEGTMRNYGAAGKFRMWQHPEHGHRYFDKDEIAAYAARNFGPPPAAQNGSPTKRRSRPRPR